MNSPIKPASPRKQSLAGARLRKHADYQRAYAHSRKRQSASMSWFLAPQPAAASCAPDVSEPRSDRSKAGPAWVPLMPRVGLTAGKVLGMAHDRNRIKRRLREILRRHIDQLPQGSDLILHPRRVVLTLEFTKLEAEVLRILAQARVEAARASFVPVRIETPARAVPEATSVPAVVIVSA